MSHPWDNLRQNHYIAPHRPGSDKFTINRNMISDNAYRVAKTCVCQQIIPYNGYVHNCIGPANHVTGCGRNLSVCNFNTLMEQYIDQLAAQSAPYQ